MKPRHIFTRVISDDGLVSVTEKYMIVFSILAPEMHGTNLRTFYEKPITC
jgi:hypothetical protein